MRDLLGDARAHRVVAAREAMAHQLSAEYHRKWHMRLGALSTAATTLVGTGLFAGLLGQLGLDGKAPFAIPSGALKWLYLGVALLALAAPVLTAFHTFLHHSEDAQRHTTSDADYTAVVEQWDAWLRRFEDLASTPDKGEALNQFDRIMKDSASARRNRLTMPAKAYEEADKELRRREPHATA